MAPSSLLTAVLGLASVALVSSTALYDGYWTKLQPGGNVLLPEGRLYHRGVAVGGRMFVLGGTAASNTTYVYDVHDNIWKTAPKTPSNLIASDLDAHGGDLVMFGGKSNDGSLNTISIMSTSRLDNWYVIFIQNLRPPARYQHVSHVVGAVVYVFGGWNDQQYFNDVWGMDMTPPDNDFTYQPKWVQVFKDGLPDSPHQRASMTMVTYGGTLYLFGGFFHNIVAGGPMPNCANAVNGCIFYDDVWEWTPNPELGDNKLTNAWGNHPLTIGAAKPVGRYEHAAAIMGKYMMIFGGTGKNGALGDLWQYHILKRKWTSMFAAGPTPGTRQSPVATVIAGSLYLFSGEKTNNDLWAWTPTDDSYLPGGGTTVCPQVTCKATDLGGVNAGIAIIAILSFVTVGMLGFFIYKSRGSSSSYSSATLGYSGVGA